MSVIYIAHDQGAISAIEPLVPYLKGRTFFGATATRDLNLDMVLDSAKLLVCGTLDTLQGNVAEARARVAANFRGVPCIVVEDFAGNYTNVPRGTPNLLVVDSESAAGLARGKHTRLDVRVVPAPRYDPFRRRLSELRSGSGKERAVLWIGQP